MLMLHNDNLVQMAFNVLLDREPSDADSAMITKHFLNQLLDIVFCDQFLFSPDYKNFKSLLKIIHHGVDKSEDELLIGVF